VSAREGYHWAPKQWAPSEMQARVLDGVARGLTNAEIAAEVGISADGVKWHVSRALAETGIEDRRALALWWQSRPDVRMSLRTALGPVTLEYRRPNATASAVLLAVGPLCRLAGSSRSQACPSPETAEWSEGWVTSSQGATRGKVRYP
jgi:DNA-binding CsgD family transcriptional regulator